MFDVRTFIASENGHEVKLEFDNRLAFINRIRLYVDGALLDSDMVWYGTKELRAKLDGAEVELRVHSGMVGEPDRPQIKRTDGSWADMAEQEVGQS
jgi:hypothetical protein